MRTAVAAVALLYASIGFAGDISAAPTATIVIKVTESGFEPREVPVAKDRPTTLVFTRVTDAAASVPSTFLPRT